MIEHTPSGTRCYCGSTDVEFCATCRGWLVENSPRIARDWQRVCSLLGRPWNQRAVTDADTAEGFYLHLFQSYR